MSNKIAREQRCWNLARTRHKIRHLMTTTLLILLGTCLDSTTASQLQAWQNVLTVRLPKPCRNQSLNQPRMTGLPVPQTATQSTGRAMPPLRRLSAPNLSYETCQPLEALCGFGYTIAVGELSSTSTSGPILSTGCYLHIPSIGEGAAGGSLRGCLH
ncbi:hypothetical protein F4778DRAFT_448326 [Xylariomycetidae sp. FL2044]|nr:hypothetical protein F4778DRAFT_448326 [Xylariomycetidae sp. FL2044]